MDHHHESSSKANCQHQRRGWILTIKHFTLTVHCRLFKSYLCWATKCLGYSLFIYSSEYWRGCSKTQQKELPLPLASHLLYSSLEGPQEIRQPLCPRNQFWCPLKRLASKDKLVTSSISHYLLHVQLTGEWQTRAEEAFADKHTKSLWQHTFCGRAGTLAHSHLRLRLMA